MIRRILLFLQKWLLKIHINSGTAINNINRNIYFMDFEDRDDDIYIATFLKSGTTWVQVIVYNLLTDGNMDFNHIYDVSPWPKNEAFNNKTVDKVNQLPSPRIFKTHDRYGFFNPDNKCKFIYVYRDGKDVAVSLYHHNKNYLDPELTFDKNFEEYYMVDDAHMNWFQFNAEWLENKNGFNILYVAYEDLKSDFDNMVKKIAAFLNVELTEEIAARTKKHASFEYMKQHESKFGEIPPNSQLIYNQFIRKGNIGEGDQYMNEQQKNDFNEKYKIFIEPFIKKIN